MKTKLNQLNRLEQEQFVELLGDIFEHSPWVAEHAYHQIPFSSVEALHQAMVQIMRKAAEHDALQLLRAHPDLATRLEISPFSEGEQQGSGLDRLTPEEYEQFSNLNRAYTEKFKFPFIFAVRGKTKKEIMQAMQARLGRQLHEEREQALVEIERITRFRLIDHIEHDREDQHNDAAN